MSYDIRLVRSRVCAMGTAHGTPHARQAVPRLGPDWWTQDWGSSAAPIDALCLRQVEALGSAFVECEDWEAPEGRPFAEVDLTAKLPPELWQAVLGIPDRFADPRRMVVLRKVDDAGSPGIRVCAADGQVVGCVEPGDLFRLDYWLEWAAYWLMASNGMSVGAIRNTLSRQLPL